MLTDPLLILEVIHKKTSPSTTSTPHPYISPRISQETTPTPKPLTVDRLEAFTANAENRPILQMYIQKTIKW